MADDDDEGFSFGDFKFAPPPPPPPPPQPQPHVNGVTSSSNYNNMWDDFFFNPITPQPSNNGYPYPSGSAQPTPAPNPSPISVDPGPNKSPNPLSFFGEDEDDDEWEFKGAISGNGVAEQGNSKEEGDSVVPGSKIESFADMDQQKQAGQDASNPAEHKPGVISFVSQPIDFFAASYGNGANHQFVENDVGVKSTTSTTNGYMWDPFSSVGDINNGNGISASSMNQDDDFDDFGDFIDASQEVVSKEQEQVGAHMDLSEHLTNGEVQEKQTQTGHPRGALPQSLFSADTEESSDCFDLQNEVVHMPTLGPGNSFSEQNSVISINDLISKLYSQTQLTSSVDSTLKPAENGVHSPAEITVTTPLGEDDDWDDGSWEFKGAYSENGVVEQLSTAILGNMAQKQSEILPELQNYIDFYDQLRDSLCFLLSCQLDELKKARSSDAVNGNGEKAEALDVDIQEASKLLKDSVNFKEVISMKNLERSSCLNKFLDVLQGPKLNVIEADFSMSKRLQLAVNEWRIAAELLRHSISMLKILSLGSADEQLLFASTWSKIINFCIQELRHGASIWERASEKNVQHQILSDSRGQQFFQALGEIYKIVELLGLSAKVYKPWILLRVSDPSQFFSVLFECGALWANSGLQEALQILSDVDFRYNETVKTFVASIKKIRDTDVVAVHDSVFFEHKSICQLSLLPQEMIPDLKTVMWGKKAYFLNLANFWANLISSDPPQLPNLQVS